MKLRSTLALGMAVLSIFLIFVGAPATSESAQARSVAAPLPVGRETLPSGAAIQTVLYSMQKPVAMAFDPQGRLFYTEKETGNVRLYANGQLQPIPVITFSVDSCNERGLLGIAIDPNFPTNRFIYVYYTAASDCGPTQNRVVRFLFDETTHTGSNPTTIFTSPQTAGNHNGGNIHFGPDGKLYVSVGENNNPANSQDITVPNGKIHRINPDGTIPTDNPNFNRPGALPSLYAMGVRNSFDFTFDPLVTGRIFASENGPGCEDEMNRIEAGFNYGWRADYPCDDENPDPNFNTIAPLWNTGQNCCIAPTGITFYTGNQIPEWHNQLFMSSYQGPALYHFYLNEDHTALTAVNTVQNVSAIMDIETGPDGALYYMEGGGYTDAVLRRIVGPGVPLPPTAQPAPSTGVTPPPDPTSTIQVPNPTPTQPTTPPTIPGAGARTFPETGKAVTGVFLDYWTTHGGLPQQGFPISAPLTEISDLNNKPYTVQYFERAVFELHPENPAPYDILLSQLGTFQYNKKYPQGAPNQQPDTSPGSTLFPETGKHVGGKFLTYWQQHGGLAQQGYPISEEFNEVSDLDGKPYTVQYFERAAFELHPENAPPYDVLLSQLGTLRYKAKYGK